MDSLAEPHLDGHGIFTVIVFSAVSIVVNYPLRIPLPFFISDFTSRVLSRLLYGKALPNSGDSVNSVSREHPERLPSNVNAARSRTQAAPEPGISKKKRRSHLTVNHVSVPLIGVLLLLITKSIGGQQIKDGIIGTSGIEPLDILALFISLAYIAISLDATGLLRFLAFRICFLASGTTPSQTQQLQSSRPSSNSSGYTLFLSLYFFFWVLGVLVGNDPVILSGTSFLIYLTRVAGISPPSAWIWAQFVAANISSAVLVSSNPTNLVVANGFGISFTTYTAFMILPSAVSAGASLLVILLAFRNKKAKKRIEGGTDRTTPKRIPGIIRGFFKSKKLDGQTEIQMNRLSSTNTVSPQGKLRRRDTQTKTREFEQNSTPELEDEHRQDLLAPLIYIPTSLVPPDVDPKSVLLDPVGAIFGTVVMLLTLILLVVTSVLGGVKVYMVAVPGAAVCLARDLVADYLRERKVRLAHRKDSTRKDESKSSSTSNGHQSEVDQEVLAIEQSITAENERRLKMSTEDSESVQKENEGTREDIAVEELTSNEGVAVAASSSGVAQISPEAELKISENNSGILSEAGQGQTALSKLLALRSKLSVTFPTVTSVLTRLPFPLLPFALGYFILVQSLDHVGFINIMARGLGKVCSNGPTVAGFFVSALAVILCNLGGTNIGSTILLTKSLQSTFFISELPAASSLLILKTSLYSIAFGSNVGALGGTFSASLAGLLWKSGLNQGGIHVKKRQFAWWSLITIFPALLSGTGILLLETRYWQVGKELDIAEVLRGGGH